MNRTTLRRIAQGCLIGGAAFALGWLTPWAVLSVFGSPREVFLKMWTRWGDFGFHLALALVIVGLVWRYYEEKYQALQEAAKEETKP